MNAIVDEISETQTPPLGLELFADNSAVAAPAASIVATGNGRHAAHGENNNPLRGLLGNDLQCMTCGRRRATHDRSFFSIPLSLHGQRQVARLLDCLHSFMQPEIVSEVECLWYVLSTSLFGCPQSFIWLAKTSC